MNRLSVRRLDERAVLPTRAHATDAGLDLRALEAASLAPGARASIGTGIAVEISAGYAGLVLPRSGLADRHGIALVNSPGLIDAGYRGEIRVLLLNTDREASFSLKSGERIAQLVLIAVSAAEPFEVVELGVSERAAAGFGSTGT